MRGRASHTSTNRGKRIRLRLKDGGTIEGRFQESNSRSVVLVGGQTVLKKDISSMIVVKGK